MQTLSFMELLTMLQGPLGLISMVPCGSAAVGSAVGSLLFTEADAPAELQVVPVSPS